MITTRRLIRLFAFVAAFVCIPVYADDTLYLYNWNNYVTDQTLARAESHCRCKIFLDYYSDNEEMLAKLEAGGTGYDIVVPTGYALEFLVRKGSVGQIDRSRFNNFSNIRVDYLDLAADPGNRYSVPYASTVTLLGFNAEVIKQLSLPTDTWALIFEPEYLVKLGGRVAVLNSQRELMGAALIYLGYSPNSHDPAEWALAKQLIIRAKPYWATFSSSTYIKDLAVGSIWVAQGYSSDIYRSKTDAESARRPFHIEMSIPKEGAVLAVDSFVISASSKRPDLAYCFLNFITEGVNAADVSNLIGAGNPNRAAFEYINPSISRNEALFPSPEMMLKLETLRDFNSSERRQMSRIWTEIKIR